MPRQSKRSPRAVKAAETERKALELRKKGLTFAAIGEKLGITEQGVAAAVQRGLERLSELGRADAEELRAMDLERADFVLASLHPKVAKGSSSAALAYLKALERRAKLLGLNAPTQHELSGPDGTPIPFADARERLAARIARLAQEPGPAGPGDVRGGAPPAGG